MSKIGNIANATFVMMETNRIAASGADRSAAERADREIEERRRAIDEKLEAAKSGIFGSIISGVVGLLGAATGVAGSILGWIGQANAAAGVVSQSVDVAATACALASPVMAGAADLAKTPFDTEKAFGEASASGTELLAEREGRAREAAERRAERAREENQQASGTLLQQMSEYGRARKFV